MLVGHNPEFSDLAHRLSSEIVDMPTSAVAEYHFDTKAWTDIGEVEPTKQSWTIRRSSSDGRRHLYANPQERRPSRVSRGGGGVRRLQPRCACAIRGTAAPWHRRTAAHAAPVRRP
jgi:hypothetical protein